MKSLFIAAIFLSSVSFAVDMANQVGAEAKSFAENNTSPQGAGVNLDLGAGCPACDAYSGGLLGNTTARSSEKTKQGSSGIGE